MQDLYNLKQRTNIILGITILIGVLLLYSLKDLFGALLGAVVMYTIFRSFYNYLTQKKRISRVIATILILFISFFIIILPFFILISMVAAKAKEISVNPEEIKLVLEKIDRFALDNFKQQHIIEDILNKAKEAGVGILSAVAGSAFNILLQISIMYFLLYFMFTQKKDFENALISFLPFKEENCILLGNELRNITYSNVLGQGFIAIIQGALLAVGYLIFGFGDPIFWGIIAIFLSFLPIVGAPIIFVPASLIAIANGDNFAGFGLLIFGLLIITNIDNVLRLIINKRIADTHPAITIVGVVIGLPLFGILGLVFGPLLISIFIMMVKIFRNNRLELISENKVNYER